MLTFGCNLTSGDRRAFRRGLSELRHFSLVSLNRLEKQPEAFGSIVLIRTQRETLQLSYNFGECNVWKACISMNSDLSADFRRVESLRDYLGLRWTDKRRLCTQLTAFSSSHWHPCCQHARLLCLCKPNLFE